MTMSSLPDQSTAALIASRMLSETNVSATRIPFGNQNYVYEIKAPSGHYVLRLTTPEWVDAYISAIGLQGQLLRLDFPVARFLQHDVAGLHSEYPALLMPKIAGTDLVNCYPALTLSQKIALADEVASIHAKTAQLPTGRYFGRARYGQNAPCCSWSAFMRERWAWCANEVLQLGELSPQTLDAGWRVVERALDIAGPIPATPLIWDMGDRNLMVHDGGVTGVVDIDDICYGDPLYTVGLAAAAFEKERWDTTYVDRWLTHYPATQSVQLRFAACRLLWLVSFMRGSGRARANGNKEPDRRERLAALIDSSIKDIAAHCQK
jgi:Ser/Thr protein kinase RdoA (MazF antagonist)